MHDQTRIYLKPYYTFFTLFFPQKPRGLTVQVINQLSHGGFFSYVTYFTCNYQPVKDTFQEMHLPVTGPGIVGLFISSPHSALGNTSRGKFPDDPVSAPGRTQLSLVDLSP